MKILLDECLPRRLAHHFREHEVRTVRDMNWLGLKNGKLLAAAKGQFDALLTVDKNIVHQQNFTGSTLIVIVIRASSNAIESLSPLVPNIKEKLESALPGSIHIVAENPD